MAKHEKVIFPGAHGVELAARLDLPPHPPRGYALFAHCFTCSKNSLAASRVSIRLAELGYGVLRFDFTGLGQSEGDFSNTNFSSNIEDLVAAAKWMESQGMSPSLAVGHSLGGAAIIAAGDELPMVEAFAVIAAPSEPGHLEKHLGPATETIEQDGEAEISIGGRPFLIKKQFLDDIRRSRVLDAAGRLERPLLIMHSPTDPIVSIDNATEIFLAAKHPRSFVSLDDADHLLSKRKDAEYAAGVIASWAEGYLPRERVEDDRRAKEMWRVTVAETGWSRYQNLVTAGNHQIYADEPESIGGADTGLSPFDLVKAGLGACTTITVRMYAEKKNLLLDNVTVDVTQKKTFDGDVFFNVAVKLEGDLTEEQREKLLEIAEKCPVHHMLEEGAIMRTIEST